MLGAIPEWLRQYRFQKTVIELDEEPATLGSSYSNINSMQTTGRYGNRHGRGSEASQTLPARVLARLGAAQAQ
jgi:hypothetical protein